MDHMTKDILVFIPNNLEKKNGYIEGFYKDFENRRAYYITTPYVNKKCEKLIGYCGKINLCKAKPNTLHIFDGKISFNHSGPKNEFVKIFYDYNSFRKSNVIENTSDEYGLMFHELKYYLKNDKTNGKQSFVFKLIEYFLFINIIVKILDKIDFIISYSATLKHFQESIKTCYWCMIDIKRKQWSITVGNVLIAKIIDLIVGLVLMIYLFHEQQYVYQCIKVSSEQIIEQLKALLLYLMGSPIGLKLNYAFNKSLGTFFFYHITLWKVFLNSLHPLLMNYYQYLIIPGAFGFTFQLAMLSDIISLSTFHVYCIYVYAARMFHVQIICLTSLWRLFTGRKFNPLRNRIDSCEYEQNQLFIGTLGFTIFLFLLPTTMMYYTVFVTFRMIMMFTEIIISQLRYALSVQPFYGVLLWLFNSPCVAGSMNIEWLKVDEDNSVNLKAKLAKLPLTSILKLVPTISRKEEPSLKNLPYDICTGVIL